VVDARQRIERLVNTPLSEQAAFRAGVARGERSYLNGLNGRQTSGLDLRSAVIGNGPLEIPGALGNTLGAASRLQEISQRISPTTRTSVDLIQSIDEFGQTINSRARNATTNIAFNTSPLSDITLGPTTFSATALPHSSIYGPDGIELIRNHGERLTTTDSSLVLDKNSTVFKVAKHLGTAGDVLEVGVDTYNNFSQDGVSARAFIASGIDAVEVVLSGFASTVVGTLAGTGAGTLAVALGVSAPAAPVIAVGTGVAVGVYTDNEIDSLYQSYRDPIINSVTSVYEFGRGIYDYVVD
jgi:hypothetical protein